VEAVLRQLVNAREGVSTVSTSDVLFLTTLIVAGVQLGGLAILGLQTRAAFKQVALIRQQIDAASNDASTRIAAERESEQVRNAFELVRYLGAADYRTARRRINDLYGTRPGSWSTEDRDFGFMVSSMWNTVGALERLCRFPPGFVAELYGEAITRNWSTVKPLIYELRDQRGTEPPARHHFEELALQIERHRRADSVRAEQRD
jgi:hypothetical protein